MRRPGSVQNQGQAEELKGQSLATINRRTPPSGAWIRGIRLDAGLVKRLGCGSRRPRALRYEHSLAEERRFVAVAARWRAACVARVVGTGVLDAHLADLPDRALVFEYGRRDERVGCGAQAAGRADRGEGGRDAVDRELVLERLPGARLGRLRRVVLVGDLDVGRCEHPAHVVAARRPVADVGQRHSKRDVRLVRIRGWVAGHDGEPNRAREVRGKAVGVRGSDREYARAHLWWSAGWEC